MSAKPKGKPPRALTKHSVKLLWELVDAARESSPMPAGPFKTTLDRENRERLDKALTAMRKYLRGLQEKAGVKRTSREN
jgi:hypothetical protein